VFAGGLLRAGCQAVLVNRGDNMTALAKDYPYRACAGSGRRARFAFSVGGYARYLERARRPDPERAAAARLAGAPDHESDRDFRVVRKKKDMDTKLLIPSPVAGPQAGLLFAALQSIDPPAREVQAGDELEYELVRKNVYILTTNIAGLRTGGTVMELWAKHEGLARQVAEEVMDIQDFLTGKLHDRERLIAGMLEAFEGDPQHGCTGRSAPARLARAVSFADEAGLALPVLRSLMA
jgi:hypothetical protein